MQRNTFLELDGIACRYGSTQVLNDIALSIDKGEFVALLGSSGCGKTTLLRVLAGFITPSAGRVRLRQQDVTDLPPDRRGVSLVFQSYALWPHMTIAQNIGYGLKLRHTPKARIAERVSSIMAMLGLEGLGERKPGALSGGQRQRVALGRALAVDPEILLLDEPLSNLDARIRLSVRHELRALQRRLGITAVHVTHDREEAMVLADRIVILNAGRIEQQGAPEEVYNRPASPFVAAFMGAENLVRLDGAVQGDRFAIAAGAANAAGAVPLAGRPLASGPVEARFRPEAARVAAIGGAPAADGVTFFGEVLAASYPGGLWRHTIRLGDDQIMADAAQAFEPGSRVDVHVASDALFLFNRTDTQPPVVPVPRTAAGEISASRSQKTGDHS